MVLLAATGCTGLASCTSCAKDTCHSHGSCFINSAAFTDRSANLYHCDCNFLYTLSTDCEQPIVLIIIISGLLGLMVLAALYSYRRRLMSKMHFERTLHEVLKCSGGGVGGGDVRREAKREFTSGLLVFHTETPW